MPETFDPGWVKECHERFFSSCLNHFLNHTQKLSCNPNWICRAPVVRSGLLTSPVDWPQRARIEGLIYRLGELDAIEQIVCFHLDIDVDEGVQFYVRSIEILGVDQVTREEILRDSPLSRGRAYKSWLLKLLIKRHPAVFRFTHDDPPYVRQELDEYERTVAITLDARPCGQD